jgi:hypothetical protein
MQRKAPWTQFAKVRGPEKKPKRGIRKVSTRMAKLLREYRRLKARWLREHPDCEVCLLACEHGQLKPKQVRPTAHVHHRRGRGNFLLDTKTWVAVCFSHHAWIHEHPEQAMLDGWMESRLKKA